MSEYINRAFPGGTIYHPKQEGTINNGKVRFLHTSTDAPNVDIYINGQLRLKNLPYKQASHYLSLKTGKYHIDIYPTGNMIDSVLNKKITVTSGRKYTFALINPVKKLRLLEFLNQPDVPLNESKMRFIHLSPPIQQVDFAVKDRDVIFPNVSFKQVTGYLGLTPMTVDLELRKAGSKTVIYPIPKVKFRPNESYTIVLFSLSKETLQVLSLLD